jgi:hypothetical protein
MEKFRLLISIIPQVHEHCKLARGMLKLRFLLLNSFGLEILAHL